MSLKLPSSTTPFPLSLKTHTLHSPHKVHFHVHVQYTRNERLVIRKKKERKRKKKRKKEDLALALQKSMSGEKSGEATGAGNLLGVQAFKSFVLALLLGADPNDPTVKALLPSLPESKCNEEEESGSKGEDEKK